MLTNAAKARSRRYYANHQEEIRAGKRANKHKYSTEYYHVNKERILEQRRTRNAAASISYRRRRNIKIAGRACPELCECCSGPGPLHFDHDHETGKFRGWICPGCNLACGMLKDNPDRAMSVAIYLENWRHGRDSDSAK